MQKIPISIIILKQFVGILDIGNGGKHILHIWVMSRVCNKAYIHFIDLFSYQGVPARQKLNMMHALCSRSNWLLK